MGGFVKESASFFNHFVMAEVLIRDGFFSFVTAAMMKIDGRRWSVFVAGRKKIIFWLELWYKALVISKKTVLLKIKGG